MEDEYKVTVNATKAQIEDFKESILWADIKRELFGWLEGFEREHDAIVDEASVSNPSTASVLLHMGDLNGRKKAIIYMLNILDMFVDTIEINKEENKEN